MECANKYRTLSKFISSKNQSLQNSNLILTQKILILQYLTILLKIFNNI